MVALQKLYELHRKSDCFRTFKDKITHSSKNLLELFQTELSDNTDYYAMYRFQYFLDQVEIEEHDYRVMEGGFWRSLETLISGSIQYTISDIHTPISEMEGDLNEHALIASGRVAVISPKESADLFLVCTLAEDIVAVLGYLGYLSRL